MAFFQYLYLCIFDVEAQRILDLRDFGRIESNLNGTSAEQSACRGIGSIVYIAGNIHIIISQKSERIEVEAIMSPDTAKEILCSLSDSGTSPVTPRMEIFSVVLPSKSPV